MNFYKFYKHVIFEENICNKSVVILNSIIKRIDSDEEKNKF